jgi:hypothetical protein
MNSPRIPLLNDGSSRPPALRIYLTMGNVTDLPDGSTGPRGKPRSVLTAIYDAGFTGVQDGDPLLCRELGLGSAVSARFNVPADIGPGVARAKADGHECLTIHLGWGHEDDATLDALVREVLAASAGEGLPVFIETHRATVTQDTWRTVQLVRRHPTVRFNGDFSHWYTGLEMTYGDLAEKIDFLTPVLDRVRFFHGRMGNSSHLQVPLSDPSMAVASMHFRTLWMRAMRGFLTDAGPGDYLIFAPELLPSGINYARLRPDGVGGFAEEGDRWQEAIAYAAIARECFASAVADQEVGPVIDQANRRTT